MNAVSPFSQPAMRCQIAISLSFFSKFSCLWWCCFFLLLWDKCNSLYLLGTLEHLVNSERIASHQAMVCNPSRRWFTYIIFYITCFLTPKLKIIEMVYGYSLWRNSKLFITFILGVSINYLFDDGLGLYVRIAVRKLSE